MQLGEVVRTGVQNNYVRADIFDEGNDIPQIIDTVNVIRESIHAANVMVQSQIVAKMRRTDRLPDAYVAAVSMWWLIAIAEPPNKRVSCDNYVKIRIHFAKTSKVLRLESVSKA